MKGASPSAACANGDHAVIDIIDNGVGIPAAEAGRVKGTGIGLRNVNERLRVIYGANYQLQLDSVPGQGTCARIVIPELRMPPGIADDGHRPTSLLRTVVVDDEQLARDELCFLLEQIGGVEVVAQAGNGVEALRVIEEYQPDLVCSTSRCPG